jgi:hypothetical protein
MFELINWVCIGFHVNLLLIDILSSIVKNSVVCFKLSNKQ